MRSIVSICFNVSFLDSLYLCGSIQSFERLKLSIQRHSDATVGENGYSGPNMGNVFVFDNVNDELRSNRSICVHANSQNRV